MHGEQSATSLRQVSSMELQTHQNDFHRVDTLKGVGRFGLAAQVGLLDIGISCAGKHEGGSRKKNVFLFPGRKRGCQLPGPSPKFLFCQQYRGTGSLVEVTAHERATLIARLLLTAAERPAALLIRPLKQAKALDAAITALQFANHPATMTVRAPHGWEQRSETNEVQCAF